MAAVPISGAPLAYTVGLITEYQEPHTPVLDALMTEAARISRLQ